MEAGRGDRRAEVIHRFKVEPRFVGSRLRRCYSGFQFFPSLPATPVRSSSDPRTLRQPSPTRQEPVPPFLSLVVVLLCPPLPPFFPPLQPHCPFLLLILSILVRAVCSVSLARDLASGCCTSLRVQRDMYCCACGTKREIEIEQEGGRARRGQARFHGRVGVSETGRRGGERGTRREEAREERRRKKLGARALPLFAACVFSSILCPSFPPHLCPPSFFLLFLCSRFLDLFFTRSAPVPSRG